MPVRCQLPLLVANDSVWCEHFDSKTRCRLKFWLDIEQMARYECSLLELSVPRGFFCSVGIFLFRGDFSVPWGFFCDAGLS